MTLVEKLDLLNLPEGEREKVIQKFFASLANVSDNELTERLEFLHDKNVDINKAKDVKVLCIPKDELMKKFSILDEIKESDIYRDDPSVLTLNVIDIYKRIKYCIANNIEYKWEDSKND